MKNKKLLTDSIWSVGSHFLSLIIVLFSNFLLARIISPKEFGQLGITMFFITIFNVFTDGGLSGALVRKLHKRQEDYSTVFTFNLTVSSIFFFIVIFNSHFISSFYNDEILSQSLNVASLILLISSLQTIPNVKLLEKLNFKRRSILTFISTFLGVGFGLSLAYLYDLGLWALVSIPVSTVFFQTLFFNMSEGFYFKLKLDKNSFRELFGFGINTTTVSVLNLAFDNIYHLVIGKVFSLGQTGYYYQAKKLQDVPNNLVNNLSQSVFFSSLSKVQNEEEKVLHTYNLISQTFLWLMGLSVLIISLFGDRIIYVLLGDQWDGAVFYLKVLIFGSFFYTQELINKMIFKVYNRTGVLLRLELLKKTVQAMTIVIGVYFKSLELLLYGYVITNAFSYFLNYFYTSKIINIGKNELLSLFKIGLIIFILLSLSHIWNIFIDPKFFYFFSFLLIVFYIILSSVVGPVNLQKIKLLINQKKNDILL